MSSVLEAFDKRFTLENLPAAVTWARDVTPEFVDSVTLGSIPWVVTIPDDLEESDLPPFDKGCGMSKRKVQKTKRSTDRVLRRARSRVSGRKRKAPEADTVSVL